MTNHYLSKFNQKIQLSINYFKKNITYFNPRLIFSDIDNVIKNMKPNNIIKTYIMHKKKQSMLTQDISIENLQSIDELFLEIKKDNNVLERKDFLKILQKIDSIYQYYEPISKSNDDLEKKINQEINQEINNIKIAPIINKFNERLANNNLPIKEKTNTNSQSKYTKELENINQSLEGAHISSDYIKKIMSENNFNIFKTKQEIQKKHKIKNKDIEKLISLYIIEHYDIDTKELLNDEDFKNYLRNLIIQSLQAWIDIMINICFYTAWILKLTINIPLQTYYLIYTISVLLSSANEFDLKNDSKQNIALLVTKNIIINAILIALITTSSFGAIPTIYYSAFAATFFLNKIIKQYTSDKSIKTLFKELDDGSKKESMTTIEKNDARYNLIKSNNKKKYFTYFGDDKTYLVRSTNKELTLIPISQKSPSLKSPRR